MPATITPSRSHFGFSLMEAVVAMSIVAFASSVLLLGVEATLESVEEQEEITIADGLARQMLDEIQGQSWVDPVLRAYPYQTSLSASADERLGPGRSQFDDTDDYNNYQSTPPVHIGGEALGATDSTGDTLPEAFRPRSDFLSNWRLTVEVAYLSESDHSVQMADYQPTNYRALICRVYRRNRDNTWREVVSRERVISYIPAHD
ncbi:type IV pilus modification PilV family protein [Bremerella sp. P1]|uniref:type IV pilus modification PilV family protein n=1 Tax=Bremerella sp. P1 TaxID=3026424 RepID=UPI002368D2E6|nr:type II secretion system protein [Bremerella sp. P1]WDI42476.1 type II secretion system protein [Bremerella sp. P1]